MRVLKKNRSEVDHLHLIDNIEPEMGTGQGNPALPYTLPWFLAGQGRTGCRAGQDRVQGRAGQGAGQGRTGCRAGQG